MGKMHYMRAKTQMRKSLVLILTGKNQQNHFCTVSDAHAAGALQLDLQHDTGIFWKDDTHSYHLSS